MLIQSLKGASLAVFLLCQSAVAEPVLIADLSQDRAAAQWRLFTDQVMGGVSEGRAVVQGGALHLTGTVSTANNGGFVQIRREDTQLPEDATTLRVELRGDGQDYYIHLRTTRTRLPWQYYQAVVTAPKDWTRIDIPLAQFAPSGRLSGGAPQARDVRSIALVAFGRDHEADVWLRRVWAE